MVTINPNEFRLLIHMHASANGFTCTHSSYFGDSAWGSYVRGSLELSFSISGGVLHVQVQPVGVEAALIAMKLHAMVPRIPARTHEATLAKKAVFSWEERLGRWKTQIDIPWLGLTGEDLIDGALLAESCINVCKSTKLAS